MNYYPFHLGDYAAHTAHLEPMEDLAYRRMLDLYYRTERALPEDSREIARLIRMKDYIAAIDAVLAEFFVRDGDGWHNKRADDELGRMQDRQAKAKASADASVNARKAKAMRDGSERSTNAQRTLSERSADVELPTPTPTPTPTAEAKASAPGTPAGAICRALKDAGIANVNPGNLRLATLLDAGATEAEFMAHVAKAADKSDPFAYLLGAVEGERKRAANTAGKIHRGPLAVVSRQAAAEAAAKAAGEEWLRQQGAT